VTRPLTLRWVLRTLERLNTISARVSNEEFARALMPYKNQKRYNIHFLGQWLLDVVELNEMAETPVPNLLCECGKEVDRDHRGAKYCSNRCRQRAYRKRVTVLTEPSPKKHNKVALRDTSRAPRAQSKRNEARP